jgi:hypothetical protein
MNTQHRQKINITYIKVPTWYAGRGVVLQIRSPVQSSKQFLVERNHDIRLASFLFNNGCTFSNAKLNNKHPHVRDILK